MYMYIYIYIYIYKNYYHYDSIFYYIISYYIILYHIIVYSLSLSVYIYIYISGQELPALPVLDGRAGVVPPRGRRGPAQVYSIVYYKYLSLSLCIYIYMCMYIYIYIYICTHYYIYIYIYIYILYTHITACRTGWTEESFSLANYLIELAAIESSFLEFRPQAL